MPIDIPSAARSIVRDAMGPSDQEIGAMVRNLIGAGPPDEGTPRRQWLVEIGVVRNIRIDIPFASWLYAGGSIAMRQAGEALIKLGQDMIAASKARSRDEPHQIADGCTAAKTTRAALLRRWRKE